MSCVLEMRSIKKVFPGVIALDDVSVSLNKGEILALLGENGAGKSTLIKILSGAYTADEGDVILDGEKLTVDSPYMMIQKGIAVVYQELTYLDYMTIADNIFVGRQPCTKYGRIDRGKLRKDTQDVLDSIGLNRDPFTEVSQLSIAEKQMVEIAKAISYNPRVLVMDEPTAALNETEVNNMFRIIRELASKGTSVIFISHKMDEIFEISDRVAVLRDGKNVGTVKTSETDAPTLVNMMVGRSIENMYPKEIIHPGEVVLEVKNISAKGVRNVSFDVRAGEIVGMFGLMGSGRTEICETLFGKRSLYGGEVYLNGARVNVNSPRSAIDNGLAYIPRERKKESLVLTQNVRNNMSLVYLNKLKTALGFDAKKETTLSEHWRKRLNIKTPSITTPIESLSGGNQQKSVIAKWLMNNPKVLILNEPTRGIDVGAKVEVYNIIEELCKEGLAIIMISSETPEIMGIADRMVVIHEGEVTGVLNRDDFDQERIMLYAIGGGGVEQ